MDGYTRYRARARRFLARTPGAFWIGSAVVGLVIFRSTALGGPAALAGRRVVVVDRAVLTGHRIGSPDVRFTAAPDGLIPEDAVTTFSDAVGRVATADLAARTVLRRSQVGVGRTGAQALIPFGWRAVGIPATDAVPALRPGEWVDVVAAFDGPSASPPEVIVPRGRVVEVSERRVTVAVPAPSLTRVVGALVQGHVLLAVAAPP